MSALGVQRTNTIFQLKELEVATGKFQGQSSFQSQRKAMPKNVQNCRKIALISCPSKEMLKLLQARAPQFVNGELPDERAGFRKGGGTRDQVANTHWTTGKAREFQKNIHFCFTDYAETLDYVDHNKLWEILQDIEIQTI